MARLKRRRVFTIVAAVAAGLQALVATEANGAAGGSPAIPTTNWTVPGVTGLDGIGSLLAAVNVPQPASGQSAANTWAMAQMFGFTGGGAPIGLISLDTEGGETFATLSLVRLSLLTTSGDAETRRLPYAWEANKFYLPFVAVLPGPVVAGFVYDYHAGTWTAIGSIPADPAWGKLSPTSSTLLVWGGNGLSDCAQFPRADHFRHAPWGLSGGTVITATAGADNVLPGGCPATVTREPTPDFRRYQAGSPTGPAAL